MPGTPLITFSRGVATVLAATSAFAPLYLARMETDGGAMSGKSSTGKVKKDKDGVIRYVFETQAPVIQRKGK